MAGRLRTLWCVALATVFAVLTVCDCAAAGENTPIRLGFTAGFTGSTRAPALELYRGAMAAIARCNQAGGIAGHPVRRCVADDRYEPGPAIENTVRFLVRDKVLALFPSMGSPTVSRVLPVPRAYRARSARLFVPVAGLEAARLPPSVRHMYNPRASYGQEIEALVRAFVAQGHRRIAICPQADAFGRGGWDGAGFEGYRNARLLLAVLTAMGDPLEPERLDAAVASLGPVNIGIDAPVFLHGSRHQGLDTVSLTTAAQGRLVPFAAMRVAAGG